MITTATRATARDGETPATIRAGTAADCAAIEGLLTDSHLPTAGVGELLATRPADFFVATDGPTDELVAVAGLEVCCDNALLRSVAVRPVWRARGLGRVLVERVVSEPEARGVRGVRGVRGLYLLTMTAEHYFPRFGFERVDRSSVPADIADSVEFKSASRA